LIPDVRLDLSSLSSADCGRFCLNYTQTERSFRFRQDEIIELANRLRFPAIIKTKSRHKAHDWECLCIILHYLSFPRRWCDVCKLFGRSMAALSELLHEGIRMMEQNHARLLRLDARRVKSRLHLFVEAFRKQGCPVDNLWAFIDGTARQICRPTTGQEVAYSGHKRYHALKYQALIAPDGMFVDLFGPIEGRINDQGLLNESKLIDRLPSLEEASGPSFFIYGDGGYAVQPRLICPWPEPVHDRSQRNFNLRMSKLRVCIEWSFNHVLSLFSFFDYKRHQKIFMRPVGSFWRVAVILANCHSCLRQSNEISLKFGVKPPTLSEYLN